MKFVFTLLFLTLLTQPFGVSAQTKKSGKDAALVRAPVVVSDREGRYIPGLKKEDFSVYQDGVKQNITSFATYDEPLNVALLLDTSGSTEDVVKRIKSAARDFVKLLNPKDKCLLATFDNQVKILNSFSSDPSTLKKSINEIKSAQLGGTLLYNAVEQVTRNAFTGVKGRKVVVLLTDGKDFGSVVGKDDLLEQFEESDILIYSVFYRTGAVYSGAANGKKGKSTKKSRRKKNVIIPTGPIYLPTEEELAQREQTDEAEAVDVLKKMSDTTAGRFYLSDAPGLNAVFKRVAGELREQYRIGYRLQKADEANTRNVVVKVARPSAVVRVRGKFRPE